MWRRMKHSVLQLLWLALVLCASLWGKENELGSLEGIVTDGETGNPVDAVTLVIKNRLFEKAVTIDGAFNIEKIPAGAYMLQAFAPGYEVYEQEVNIQAETATRWEPSLAPMILKLKYVTVAPSTFSLLERNLGSSSYLDRETIKKTPHFGDDPYRSLEFLPGASSGDFGSAFQVRGGQYREVAVQLDGMELIDPFHLKDFTGVFSILDPEILQGMNLSTGGYAAKFGNAMSGVLEMETRTPSERRLSASVSFGNLSFRTEGSFANGLGGYLFSGRRGYLDILLSFTEDEEEEEESDISYYDAYGKVFYTLNAKHKLSANFLLANDDFLEKEMSAEENEEADSTYEDYYTWVSLKSWWTDRLGSQTVVYFSDFSRDQTASSFEVVESYQLRDRRDLRNAGIKQDWDFSLGTSHYLRWGFDLRSVEADYDYFGEIDNEVPLDGQGSRLANVRFSPSGDEYSAYLTDRFRFGPRTVAEIGLRYDRQTLLKDDQISPRFNLSHDLGKRGALRLAYGVYHQAERAHDLQIADGVDRFSLPEKSTHYLLGYDRRFGKGIEFRIEAYLKDFEDLRTRYENLTRSVVQYAGTGPDRVAIPADTGEVKGVEVIFKQNIGGTWSWFVNYAWSRAEDEVDGETIPRQWDQEHTVNFNLNYRYGKKWNVNMAWIYHTGWRTTPLELVESIGSDGAAGYEILPGPFFSNRLSAYHRMDLRINRQVFINQRRGFELYLDIANLYNRKNQRGYSEIQLALDENGQAFIDREEDTWLPILPSFGLTWRF